MQITYKIQKISKHRHSNISVKINKKTANPHLECFGSAAVRDQVRSLRQRRRCVSTATRGTAASRGQACLCSAQSAGTVVPARTDDERVDS
jgi:hypothetical protein